VASARARSAASRERCASEGDVVEPEPKPAAPVAAEPVEAAASAQPGVAPRASAEQSQGNRKAEGLWTAR
jgi:hypothetical protein